MTTRQGQDRRQRQVKAGQHTRLVVKDTGCGMPEEVMDRVFEPFFPATVKCSGMGLAVMHGTVDSHGGASTVKGKQHKGSRFTVYLPVEEKPARSESGEQETPVTDSSREKRQRVLLVDDEGLVLMSVQRALERLGYEVESVRDGPDALKLFCDAPDSFDVVITDQTMPKMTGAELAEELLHIRPDIPVILSTGFSEIISEQEARDMGVRDLLMKPATTKDLDRAIRKATGRPG